MNILSHSSLLRSDAVYAVVDIQIRQGSGTLDSFINNISTAIINPVLLVLAAVAVMFFIFSIVNFIYYAENDEKRVQGKRNIFWGLIGMMVVFSIFGILEITKETGNRLFSSSEVIDINFST